jgi:hypothetical protein
VELSCGDGRSVSTCVEVVARVNLTFRPRGRGCALRAPSFKLHAFAGRTSAPAERWSGATAPRRGRACRSTPSAGRGALQFAGCDAIDAVRKCDGIRCRQGALCSRLAMKASRSFAASAPGVEHPDLGCVDAHGASRPTLWRSLQLGFQVQNDIAEQTCRERIGGLPLHRSIARHLISALLPILAVSHGGPPML